MATIEALYKLQELESAIKKNKADLADIVVRIERDEAAVHAHALAVRAQRALAALEAEQARLDGEVQDTVGRLKGLDQQPLQRQHRSFQGPSGAPTRDHPLQ